MARLVPLAHDAFWNRIAGWQDLILQEDGKIVFVPATSLPIYMMFVAS
jgi:hypothetical protein